MKYIVGVDTGGTFTDITVMTEDGEIYVEKAPTTPKDFSQGIIDCVNVVAKGMGISTKELLANCVMFKHGSTIATNALITREGSRVGLITTRGFEDTTLIMRGIGRVAGLSEDELKHQATAVKPEPIVPKELIKGVTERIDYAGKIVIPINEEEARQALKSLVADHGVEAIAVNFLWGFVNPVHEKWLAELAKEMYGERDIYLSFAHELVPVIREYARSNTVIINAFLGKTIARYLSKLGTKLSEAGYNGPLLIMQSNGGIVHESETTPIGNVGSGPCGGIIASKYMADLLGHSNVISTDMGGTSFDVGLITDGFWRYARSPIVARFHITWPMIDIESIGAGGGTIAWIDPITNRLRLGPKSAAADPGPVCYDARGTEPTVTDADLVLGILDQDYFLGGRMKLNIEKARRAIKEKIADKLGMDVVQAAGGIFDVINGHMSDLIRKQVVRTGHIPEEFVIYSFGGAGPVHATAYGSDLGVEKVIVFPTSSVFSSFGIAAADIIHTYTTSYRYSMPVSPEVMNAKIKDIEDRLYVAMEREGVPRRDVSFRRIFYMRYKRQLNELMVQVPVKVYDDDDIASISDEFEKRYEEVYGEGSAYREAGIEIISINVDAIGKTIKPAIRTYPSASTVPPKEALKGKREVYFSSAKKFVKTNIYQYENLRPANIIDGPSIIETPITTIVVPPDKQGVVDKYMNIEIRL